jgi:hypothetical protein
MFLWDSVITAGLEIINKVIPDPAAKAEAQLKLLQLQQEGAFKVMDNELAILKTQTDANIEQAKNPSVFVSGARPAVMWVGTFGLMYQWIIIPVATFFYTMYTGHPLPVTPPDMDPNLIMLIGSLLGIQIGARTYEKVKGVAAV